MSGYIFNIIIGLVFLYEAIICFTKKNGGSERHRDRYTEESLAKFSIISGILMLLLAVWEGVEIVSRAHLIEILPVDDSGSISPAWIGIAPIIAFLIIYLICYFVILKKRDDYVDPRKGGNDNYTGGSKDDDEEF